MAEMIKAGQTFDLDIRRSLIEAAGAFLEEDKEDTTARSIILNGMLDREYVVRLDAVDTYRDLTGEDHSDALGNVTTIIDQDDIEEALVKYKDGRFATIYTNKGDIDILLDYQTAPLTVLNFVKLIEEGFYDGLIFHRVIAGFVAQGGDPRGDGWGRVRIII